MSGHMGTLTWRVTAAAPTAVPNAFDALIVPTGDHVTELAGHPTRMIGAAIPYEATLPDIPVTLIVQARAGSPPLLVQCDVVGPDGVRRVYGHARQPLAVIVRTSSGIRVTGLPVTTPDFPPAT